MIIKEVSKEDLDNIKALWNNGKVMNYVGFPQGLGITDKKMEAWFSQMSTSKIAKAYAIYEDTHYVGELFYNIKDIKKVIIDIKINPEYWGKGYARYALSYLLNEIFKINKEAVCFVDPNKDNASAIRLYKQTGFKETKVLDSNIEMEVTWSSFKPSQDFLNKIIKLKTVVEADIPRLWELGAKEETYEWIKTNAPYFNEFKQMSYEEFLKNEAKYYLNKKNINAIWYGNVLIGMISYYWEHEGTRWLEMGIAIQDDSYWSKGIGEHVFKRLGQHLFDTLEIERIGFTSWSGNPGMMHVGKKLGMTLEKQVRNARYYDGTYYDSIGYGITRQEWNALYNIPFKIYQIYDETKKSEICDTILRSLPNWFGIEDSIKEYVEGVKNKEMWVIEANDNIVGFASNETLSDDTKEIYVMGIHPDYHKKGMGTSLIESIKRASRVEGMSYLMVKTLDETHSDTYYEKTRKFYEHVGFKKLYVDKELWGKENPCLFLIQKL